MSGNLIINVILLLFLIDSCDNSEKSICESKSRINKQFFCKDNFILSADVFDKLKDLILLGCLAAIEEAKKCKNKSPIKPDAL
ncbi:MAG TPA: hypothetical protein PK079_20465 [Leptospiraceae bacterium]|nr:hypothetical protein [Leptospiraceae bacterium]HMX32162.1 hypothetical protein [Leptospiraceae bacterium]HMY32232.1 hypothetical protein [Leptospiraceae bacterium]HMZ63922.1 hypothetical protein [Leptospiraceae bacterium]HNA09738.1 hypothetical protein [Leptospiraceae bacterium]